MMQIPYHGGVTQSNLTCKTGGVGLVSEFNTQRTYHYSGGVLLQENTGAVRAIRQHELHHTKKPVTKDAKLYDVQA